MTVCPDRICRAVVFQSAAVFPLAVVFLLAVVFQSAAVYRILIFVPAIKFVPASPCTDEKSHNFITFSTTYSPLRPVWLLRDVRSGNSPVLPFVGLSFEKQVP